MIGIGIDGRAERRRTGIEGRTPRTVNQVHLDVGMRRCEAGQAATREKKTEDKKTERLMGKKSRTKREGADHPARCRIADRDAGAVRSLPQKVWTTVSPASPTWKRRE